MTACKDDFPARGKVIIFLQFCHKHVLNRTGFGGIIIISNLKQFSTWFTAGRKQKRELVEHMETMEAGTVLIGRDEFANMDHVQNFNQWMKQSARPYREMMSFYSCAIMEVETNPR